MGMLNLIGGGFACGGEVDELLAFLVTKPDNIFFVGIVSRPNLLS
jgi:hypothetical protein